MSLQIDPYVTAARQNTITFTIIQKPVVEPNAMADVSSPTIEQYSTVNAGLLKKFTATLDLQLKIVKTILIIME